MMDTAQKMKFSIKDFLSKSDQIRRKLLLWSYLLKKSLMENFIFCAVGFPNNICFVQNNLCKVPSFCTLKRTFHNW